MFRSFEFPRFVCHQLLGGWALAAMALAISLPGGAAAADKTDNLPAAQTLFELGEGKKSQYGFRIPSLAVSNKGTLLAFSERRVGLHDHAENDIVLRRSHDEGQTWGPLQVVAEEGGDSLNDPCVVVLDSGRILLRYTRFPQGVHARNSSRTVIAEPGYGGPKNVRIYLMHSDDDGATWSKPDDVTRVMRRKEAISLGSPGAGIVLTQGPHRGRIVLPNYEVYHLGGGKRNSANSVSYSDDGGKTWQLSSQVPEPEGPGTGNEAELAELTGGGILLTARDQDGGVHRKLSTSRDGGQTWSTHRRAEDLLTPQCMSSVIRYSWPTDGQPGLLLHSLPHTKDRRANGTLFASRDDGATWTPVCVIEPGDFAYSSLARLPGGDVGCLYETDDHQTTKFVPIPAAVLPE